MSRFRPVYKGVWKKGWDPGITTFSQEITRNGLKTGLNPNNAHPVIHPFMMCRSWMCRSWMGRSWLGGTGHGREVPGMVGVLLYHPGYTLLHHPGYTPSHHHTLPVPVTVTAGSAYTVMTPWAQIGNNPWVRGDSAPQDPSSCYSCYERMRRVAPLFLTRIR